MEITYLYTSKKIAKAIGIISIARRVFNRTTLQQLYYAFVYPYLIFGNIIWGKAGDTILWPIRPRTSTSYFFKEMEILKLQDIHTLVVGLFMFKYKTDNLLNIFHDFFKENNEFHSYPT